MFHVIMRSVPLELGAGAGAGAGAEAPPVVVNDHTGPSVVPLLLLAAICQ
jgi:hypothetical protein